MKTRVIGEIVADRTEEGIERFLNSRWLERGCWAAVALASLYFLPVIVRLLAR